MKDGKITNKHNSPLKWWNLHPAANGSEHHHGSDPMNTQNMKSYMWEYIDSK